jgi:hypothetical protein
MEQEPDLKAQVDIAVNAVARQNTVILGYRDELYRRLPKTPETFAAAMDDLFQRATAVADGKDLVKLLVADVREWSTADARSPQQLAAIAKAARRLADTKGSQYYQTPYWSTSNNLFQWRKTRSGVDGSSSLKDLAVFLEDLSQQPQLEIKEKKN